MIRHKLLRDMVGEIVWTTIVTFVASVFVGVSIATGHWWIIPAELAIIAAHTRIQLRRIAENIRQVFV